MVGASQLGCPAGQVSMVVGTGWHPAESPARNRLAAQPSASVVVWDGVSALTNTLEG